MSDRHGNLTTLDPRSLDEQLDDIRRHGDGCQRQLNELKERCRELERAKSDRIKVLSKALDRAVCTYERMLVENSHAAVRPEAMEAVTMLRDALEKELNK